MSTPDPRVRRIEPSDLSAVVGLIHELAEYERAGDECTIRLPQLERALFGDAPALFGHVGVVDGAVVACALWFLNFSTWNGAHGIYLEDLFVQPPHRKTGVGRALMIELARECARCGYTRLEWAVLKWNEPAIEFYRTLGAEVQDAWSIFRLTADPLARLAQS